MANYIRVNQLQIKGLGSSKISFEVEKGEVVAIAGPNGAGKSGLLRYLAGMERPDAMGRLMIGGLDPFHSVTHPKIHRMVEYISENPENQLVMGNVVREMIFESENMGVEAEVIRKRSTGFLKKFGMYHQRNKAYHQMSGSERQKAALLATLAAKSDILILDNPVWGYDLGAGCEIMRWIIKTAKKYGQTIIYTSQNKEELRLADRVIYLYDGEIHKEPWTPLEVKGEVRIGHEISGGFFVPDYVTKLEHGLEIKEYHEAENQTEGLIVEDLMVTYGKKSAISGFSYPFTTGVMYQIVGPLGSGKTSLCEAIAGIKPITAGSIQKSGNVGMSPDNPELVIFEESVMLQVMFGLKDRWGDKKTAEEKAKEALNRLCIFEGLWDKNPCRLSFGEKKMVDIAGLLAREPEILVLDLPFHMLDYENREILLQVLRDYARKHIVILTGEIADE